VAAASSWHLRQAWAPLTFTDQNPPAQDNPLTPARRSAHAQAKASYQRDAVGRPYRSFRGLMEHLATLTRNQVRFAGTKATIAMLADQRPAGSFRPHRRPNPGHPRVARTPPGQIRKTPGQSQFSAANEP
jgi:hypothetical protein